jgi:predicted RNA-binding protein with TRAM domain
MQADVSWGEPAEGGITLYTVTVHPGGITKTTTGARQISVDLFDPSIAYSFTVTATNAAGTSPTSAPSNEVYLMPIVPPIEPSSVSAVAGDRSALVAWSGAFGGGLPITGYRVTSDPGGISVTTDGETTSATVAGLTNGIDYTFRVVTIGWSESPPSAPSRAVTPKGAPPPPTAVSVERGDTAVKVNWTPPITDGGSPLTGYTVTATPGGQTGSAPPEATSLVVTGLTNGTTYRFSVKASNALGASDAVLSPEVVPLEREFDPPAVIDVSVNPQIVNTAIGESKVTVQVRVKDPSGVEAGTTATFYLSSDRGSQSSALVPMTLESGTLFDGVWKGVATMPFAATPGSWSVVLFPVYDGWGNSSYFNTIGTIINGTAPGVPTGVSAVAGNTQAVVSWTAPASDGGTPVSGYTVTSSPGGRTCTTGAALSCTLSGLSNGTAYTFTVTATNAVGTGPVSAASSPVTPQSAPGAPTAVSAIAGNAQAAASWTAPAFDGGSVISGYTVTSSPGGMTCTTGGALSCTVSGLINATAYTFTVTATNALGVSAPSEPSAPVVPVAPVMPDVAAPTLSQFDFSPKSVDVNSGAKGVVVTARVTDATGANAPTLIISSDSTTQTLGFGPMSRISGTATDGVYQRTVTIPTTAATGGWTVKIYPLDDTLGNGDATFHSHPQKLTVTNTPTDTAPPVLSQFDFTPKSVNIQSGTKDVVVTARVTDATGANAPTLIISSDSTTQTLGFGSMSRISGTATDGVYQRTVTIPTTAATGAWTVKIYPLDDALGNDDATFHSHPQKLTVTNATAPGAPTGVTATAGNAQASVSWVAPASTGGAAITGYTVTSTPGGKTCTTTSALSCTVSALTNGTAYTFTVTATNSAGDGPASAPSNSVTPLASVAVPGAPTGVTATAGNAQASVSWVAPASTGGAAITGYTVTSTPGGRTCTTTSALSCTVSALTNGTAYTFNVTATNSAGTGAPSAESGSAMPRVSPIGSGFTAVSPKRVLDTRIGVGAPKAKIGAGRTVTLTIPGLPAGTTAVTMNVTATNPSSASYVSVYPAGTARSSASNLNVVRGQTIPNLVTVAVGAGNKVTLFNNSGTIDLIADLAGYYTDDTGSGFTAVSPKRVLDTRIGVGAPKAKIGAGRTVTLTIPGLPAGTTAVTMNVTATNPSSASYVSVYPAGTARSSASNLNVVRGQTIPNLVTVAVGAGNKVTLFNNSGTIDLIADLAGYYAQ